MVTVNGTKDVILYSGKNSLRVESVELVRWLEPLI